MAVEAVVPSAKRKARRAGNSEWLDRAARVGFVARGVLYLTVAFLAVSIVRGRSGESADKQGAVRALDDTSIGTFLMVVLVAGFVGLGLWQGAEAVWGKRQERDEKEACGQASRGGGQGRDLPRPRRHRRLGPARGRRWEGRRR